MSEAHTLGRNSTSADVELSKYDEENAHDLEASKFDAEKPHETTEESIDIISEAEFEKKNLQRGLSQRHLSMIALAGSIGTGLFLSLGSAIATAGPLGSLLAYLFIGLIVCAVQYGKITLI
jgi:amino acid transporter